MVLQQIKTLEEQALDVVIRNMNRFMKDFYSPESFIPPRYFEFLQRRHSKGIMSAMCATRVLEDEVFSFFLNPYLKELDMRQCTSVNHVIFIQRLRSMGHTLTHLAMPEMLFSEEILVRALQLCPSLVELNLIHSRCSDKVLRIIGSYCTKIRTLDLSLCRVSDEGLMCLSQEDENGDQIDNVNLTKLYLSDTNVSEHGLYFVLNHCPNLEVVHHDELALSLFNENYRAFNDGTLHEMPKFNLTRLSFFSHFVGYNREQMEVDILTVCSVLCPRISTLIVDLYSPHVLTTCCAFTCLTNVKLSTSSLVDYDPFLISRGPNLKKLHLVNGSLTLEVLTNSCRSLNRLNLKSVELHPSPTQKQDDAFPELNYLSLEGFKLVDQGAENALFLINCCRKLEVLRLGYCSYLDRFVTFLLTCDCIKTLRELDLSLSTPTVTIARSFLTSNCGLKTLKISVDNVPRQEYEKIRKFTKRKGIGIVMHNDETYCDKEHFKRTKLEIDQGQANATLDLP